MKLFTCSSCQEIVYFENAQCTKCGHLLAYAAEFAVLTALELIDGAPVGTFLAVDPGPKKGRVRVCGNQTDHQACN